MGSLVPRGEHEQKNLQFEVLLVPFEASGVPFPEPFSNPDHSPVFGRNALAIAQQNSGAKHRCERQLTAICAPTRATRCTFSPIAKSNKLKGVRKMARRSISRKLLLKC